MVDSCSRSGSVGDLMKPLVEVGEYHCDYAEVVHTDDPKRLSGPR